MSRYRVTGSPYRQFLIGLAGIVLVLAAMDILWLHKVSEEPQTNDEGQVTTRGQAWHRTDLIWGAVFLLTGGGLFAVATVGLASGTPIAEITDDGLRLRIAGPQKMVTFPWHDLVEVRSALAEGDGARRRPILVVSVTEPRNYSHDVWRAEWIGSELHVDADGWAEPPEQLAVRMELELEQWRRHATGTGEPAADV